jgi:hypothetical protein
MCEVGEEEEYQGGECGNIWGEECGQDRQEMIILGESKLSEIFNIKSACVRIILYACL